MILSHMIKFSVVKFFFQQIMGEVKNRRVQTNDWKRQGTKIWRKKNEGRMMIVRDISCSKPMKTQKLFHFIFIYFP